MWIMGLKGLTIQSLTIQITNSKAYGNGLPYTAISRRVVGRSARDNTERYCGWFCVRCSSKEFERIAREAMDIRLRMLKESNKSRFESYSARNSILIISHIAFRDCRMHNFSDNLPRNSFIYQTVSTKSVAISILFSNSDGALKVLEGRLFNKGIQREKETGDTYMDREALLKGCMSCYGNSLRGYS